MTSDQRLAVVGDPFPRHAQPCELSVVAAPELELDVPVAAVAGGAQLSVLSPEIIKALRAALESVLDEEAAKNPLFKKILDSQRAFAQRAGAWQNDYLVDFKMAYNHYFGKK